MIDVEAPIEQLRQHGRQCMSGASDEPSKGTCVGLAVAHGLGPKEVHEAAEAMLEDWNAHLARAAIRALRLGHCERDGRRLTITLPPQWGNARVAP